MAESALRSSSESLSPSTGKDAIPILTLSINSRPSILNGSLNRLSRFSVIACASAASASPPSNTINSSPPRRPTVSPLRTTLRKRTAASIKSLSPVSWPNESLIFLKSSRSRNRTATTSSLRCASFNSCDKRSSARKRLGRSVSVSKCAWCRI